MAAPLKLTPTAAGQKILKIVLVRYGSISAAARAADVSEPTLRRKIYETPRSLSLETALRLEKIGIPRALLTA